MTEPVLTVARLVAVAEVAETAKAQAEAISRDFAPRLAQLEANDAVRRAGAQQALARDAGVARDIEELRQGLESLKTRQEAHTGRYEASTRQAYAETESLRARVHEVVADIHTRLDDLEDSGPDSDEAPAKPRHLRSVTDIEDDRLRGYSELTVNGVLFVEAHGRPDADLLGRAKDALETVARKVGIFGGSMSAADRACFYSVLADLEKASL